MTSKRITIVAGGSLAAALLIGTAGLAFAQDPTPSPSANPAPGPGMMGGAGGPGMMGGAGGSGMMGGAGGSGMMGGAGGAGMMDGVEMEPANLTPEQLERMQALHDQMVASGTCDPAQMQLFHRQIQPGG